MIDWFLLHAVHRTSDTLQRALRSFHAAGITDIGMLMDNGTRGPVGATDRALEFAGGPSGLCCVLQDDMILCRDALVALGHGVENLGDDACFAMYSPANNVPHEDRNKNGWVRLSPSLNTWGGMLVMPRKVAQRVHQHPNWRRHVTTAATHRQADAAVYDTLRLMGVRCWQHVPSLSEHIGQETSTIGNNHDQASLGLRFNEWG